MHRHRQVSDPFHFYAIGSTPEYEFGGGFPLQAINQKDDRNVLLHLTEEIQYLRFLPMRAGVLDYHHVKGFRTDPLGELLGSHNYVCAENESRLLEFSQAMLNFGQETIDKEDAHKAASQSDCVERRSSGHLLHVWFFTATAPRALERPEEAVL